MWWSICSRGSNVEMLLKQFSCFPKLPESILQSFLLVLVKTPVFSYLGQQRKKSEILKISQAKNCQTQASVIRPFSYLNATNSPSGEKDISCCSADVSDVSVVTRVLT